MLRASSHAGPDFTADFAAALTRPDRDVPAGIIGPRGKSAVKRYNVYRNNVTVSLIDALAAIYPAVQRITGADFFRAMARFHLRETPPTSPLLFDYGRDFPAFIARYPHAQHLPWLSDVALVERAWLDAYHAADAEPLGPDVLAQVPAEQLGDIVFVPHPATRIVRSPYAVATIFAANRNDGQHGDIDASAAETVLITRPDAEVCVHSLPAGGDAFFTRLIEGMPLGQAAATVLEETPTFDIAAAIAASVDTGSFKTIMMRGPE